MMPWLKRWLPATLSTIARFTEFSARTLALSSIKGVGMLERHKTLLHMVLELDLDYTSVNTILLRGLSRLLGGR